MTSNSLTAYHPQEGPLDLVEVRMDAERYPRIKTIPASASAAGIAEIIGAAFAYAGRQLSQEDLRFMAAALLAELMNDYDGVGTGDITLDELNYCIRRAVLGLGPEMYGINVASLYKVVCHYCVHEGHDAQEAAYRRKVAIRKKELAASAAGAMLDAYTGALLKTTNPHNK